MPLVERRQGTRAYFAASGRDVEPPEWYGPAPPSQRHMPPSARGRRTYYAILASELWHQKQVELSQGLDARGLPLIPVQKPRKGRSDWHRRLYRRGHGPPLMPFLADSRARNLLRVRSNERQAIVYWAAKRAPGKRITWPEILVAHAEGLVRGAPARNIIGISPDGLRLAVERSIKRYRIGSGPRKLELPKTTRWDASKREARKAEAGGDPFDVRFERVSVVERVGRSVMRLFRRPAPVVVPPTPPPPTPPVVAPKPPKPPKPKAAKKPKPPAPPPFKPIDWRARGWPDAIKEIAAAKGDRIRAGLLGEADRADRIAAEADARARETMRLQSLGRLPGDPEYDEARRAMIEAADEARAARDRVRARLLELMAPRALAARERDDAMAPAVHLATQRRDRTIPLGSMGRPDLEAKAAEAEAFLGSILSADGRPNPIRYGYAVFEATNPNQRAYHKQGAIAVSESNDVGIHVHELAHAVERQSFGLAEAAAAFRAYRLAGEPQQSLEGLFPGLGFKVDETGAKDRFDEVWDGVAAYYVGKAHKNSNSTEVISMGIEQLYRDPVKLARKDPEFFDFLLGALQGEWLNP